LVHFSDDLNLLYIETYDTQNSLAQLRQHIHKTFFDRVDLGFRKEIVDVQHRVGHEPAAGPFISDEHILRFSRA